MHTPGVDFETLRRLFQALHDEGVDYVLVGGIALGLQGLVRATQDIDLFVDPAQENIARIQRALRRVWDDPAIEDISAQDLAGDYPVVRYGPPDGGFGIDLMSRLGTAVAYADIAWEPAHVEGTPVRVATPRALYDMKKATVRPIDRADADALRRKFGLEDD